MTDRITRAKRSYYQRITATEPPIVEANSESEEVEEKEASDYEKSSKSTVKVSSIAGRTRGRGRGRPKKVVPPTPGEPPKEGEEAGTGATVADVPAPTPAKLTKAQKKQAANFRAGVTLGVDEMVQGSLLYFLLMQHKKVPVKRSEVVKHAMNAQTKNFPEVIDKLEKVFDEVFGVRLIGLEEGGPKTVVSSSYIVTSKFMMSVGDGVTMRNCENDFRRAILFVILSCSFMLNRSVDEDMIWKLISDLGLNGLCCKKREDFHRFLKSEYVTSSYLSMEEMKDTDPAVVRYTWGPRSDKEFSKYMILKFVSKQFPGKKPYEFTVQYGIVLETEKELVEADLLNEDNEMNLQDPDLLQSDGEEDSQSQEELLSQDNENDAETELITEPDEEEMHLDTETEGEEETLENDEDEEESVEESGEETP